MSIKEKLRDYEKTRAEEALKKALEHSTCVTITIEGLTGARTGWMTEVEEVGGNPLFTLEMRGKTYIKFLPSNLINLSVEPKWMF